MTFIDGSSDPVMKQSRIQIDNDVHYPNDSIMCQERRESSCLMKTTGK